MNFNELISDCALTAIVGFILGLISATFAFKSKNERSKMFMIIVAVTFLIGAVFFLIIGFYLHGKTL